MAFMLVMVGIFCIIYMKPPIFKQMRYDYVYLLIVLILLSIIVINGTFIDLMSDGLLVTLTLMILSPLYVKTFSAIGNKGEQNT
ncbi:hypothetical protein [Oceanobacillus sp. AG]|uniref:hypothetical protein n=1 Tax=Oceanobacillus sp. AG TaxID=2681969 RepID=UPI0012EBCCE0|nr:hypothetical protein [Oceanobacillus sp. AG]